MSIGDNGGTLEVAQGTVFTHTGTVETDSMAEGTSGPIVKKGAGVWQMTGEFKAQSELCIEEGVVRLGSAKGIGDSTAQVRSISPTEILKNGTLDVAGFNSNVGNFYLRGGAIVDSAGGGSVGAYTFFAESGTVAVPLTNVICPNVNNYFVANNLVKTSSGTLELSAANTFTGTAFVHEGNLLLTGSLAGSCYVDGGTLEGSGSIAGYAYITKNGALTATPGAVLSLGDKMAVDGGGALLVAANAGAVGTFELTSVDGAVYLGDDANLKFDLRDGSLGALAGEKVIVKIPEGAVVSGQFSNFVDGKYRDAFGNKYMINYSGGDGNDIALVSRGSGLSIIVR
jgi:autotransporter-associated beta strand protein